MTPHSTPILPHDTEQWKQGYKEGYEAGKSAVRNELKEVLAKLKGKEPFASTSTYTF